MQDFEAKVMAKFDVITERLDGIERSVSGTPADPNNKGIFGKLKAVDDEIENVNEQQRRITDDVVIVKAEQDRQKAWLKGMAFGLAVTGGTGIVTLAQMIAGK